MTRHAMTLWNDKDQARARQIIAKAPAGTRLEFKAPQRSIDQNSRMWLMLSEISRQVSWHGQKYTPEEWKDFHMHAYRGEKWMPAEDGGMVPIGRATSKLSKGEFSEFLELISAFCARQNVTLPWDENEPR